MPKEGRPSFLPILLFLSIPSLIHLPSTCEARDTRSATIISEQWMELRMKDMKIGFTYQKMERTSSGYRMIVKTVMKVKSEGKDREVASNHTYLLDKNHKPSGFTFMKKMDNHGQYFDGTISNGIANITIRSGENISKRNVPFPETSEFIETASYIIGKKMLQPGMEFDFDVFMESQLATQKMKVKVVEKTSINHRGKKVAVFKVAVTLASYETFSFISPDGRTLREESPIGFTAIETDKADAISFKEGVMPFTQMLTFSLIPVTTQLKDADRISKLTLEMNGLSKEGLIPSDSRQKQETVRDKSGFRTRIKTTKEVPKSFVNSSARLPVKGMESFLKPTIDAQSDDPSIIATARKIIGDEKNGYKAGQLINDWVFKNIRKSFIDTFSAVETLSSMEGECQSHTILFAALAKSVGLPVKTVSGIVYSDRYKGFLYHAWPEIYIGNGLWVAMDPTLGEETVDVTHIKLVEGDISEQMKIFEFIGKVGIEIISFERNG